MRTTISVVSFYIWLTAASNLLLETGFVEATQGRVQVTATDHFSSAIGGMQQVTGGGVSSESLIGLYIAVTEAAKGITDALTAAPQMMHAIGLPMVFVAFLHAPLGLIAGRYGIYLLTGR